MGYLVDTNVLLRSLALANPHKAVARNAIKALLQNGAELCIAPQNLIEFWSVCTRPEKKNGLGKTVASAAFGNTSPEKPSSEACISQSS